MTPMFDSAPLSLSAPLLQSDAFARALTATGQIPHRLDDGTIVMTRRMPGGFRISQIDQAEIDPWHLPDLVRDAGLGRRPFLLRPDRSCPGLTKTGAIRLSKGASVYELPLGGDLSLGLTSDFEKRVAHARDHEVRVRHRNLPMDPGHWIFGSDTPSGHANLITLAYAAANPGCAKLFTAHIGETRIAALLLLLHGDVATLH